MSPASERQGLVNMKVWMKKSPTQDTRTQPATAHVRCFANQAVEASENEQYLGTIVCGPIFEFIKGIPIGFPHWTSNNGAVSFLIEDSPNPWQMLGGAREM